MTREFMTMRIGITGHQRLDDFSAWGWVEEMLVGELERSDGSIMGINSLAIGVDQLFSRLVLNRGGQLHVVVPFAEYERIFDSESAQVYRELLARATNEVLERHGSDEDQFLAAGQRVVEMSDLLIAVWDGLPARGKGGTADVVSFAIAQGVPLVHIDPVNRTVERKRESAGM